MVTADALGVSIELLHRAEDRVSSAFTVDMADGAFDGHYPGFPVLPGAMLVDAVSRTVRTWVSASYELDSIERCRFVRPVYPGERVVVDVGMAMTAAGMRADATVSTGAGHAARIRLTYRAEEPAPAAGHGLDRITMTIPHRPPILLLDRVDEVRPGEFLRARKAISVSEPCFHRDGLFDTTASFEYPRALMLESCAQAAALLAVWEQPNPDVLTGKVELAGALTGVTFGRAVLPGDMLVHEVTMVRAIDDSAVVSGRTMVDGQQVLRIDSIVLALRPVSECPPAPKLELT